MDVKRGYGSDGIRVIFRHICFQHGVKFHFEMVCGHVSDTFEAQAACSGCNPGLHDAVVARIHHEPDKLPLPAGTEVDPVEFGKFRRNLTHGRRVVQSTRLAKKSAEVVLQLHAPAALALQSYMVCNPASLMIYGYMTGVYTGQHTASNESFGHGIIVVVNVYRAVAVRGMLLGLKAAHRLRSRLQAVQIGADTLLLLTVADAGDTRSGVDFM